jgi:hypothetical protein
MFESKSGVIQHATLFLLPSKKSEMHDRNIFLSFLLVIVFQKQQQQYEFINVKYLKGKMPVIKKKTCILVGLLVYFVLF